MKMRMVSQQSGLRHDGRPWSGPGNELEVDAEEGAALAHNGIAVPVAEEHRTREERRPDPADPAVETRAEPAKPSASKASARKT